MCLVSTLSCATGMLRVPTLRWVACLHRVSACDTCSCCRDRPSCRMRPSSCTLEAGGLQGNCEAFCSGTAGRPPSSLPEPFTPIGLGSRTWQCSTSRRSHSCACLSPPLLPPAVPTRPPAWQGRRSASCAAACTLEASHAPAQPPAAGLLCLDSAPAAPSTPETSCFSHHPSCIYSHVDQQQVCSDLTQHQLPLAPLKPLFSHHPCASTHHGPRSSKLICRARLMATAVAGAGVSRRQQRGLQQGQGAVQVRARAGPQQARASALQVRRIPLPDCVRGCAASQQHAALDRVCVGPVIRPLPCGDYHAIALVDTWLQDWSSTLLGAAHMVMPVSHGVARRERKKAKVGELQGMVTALSDKLQELTTARGLNAQLRERNRALAQVCCAHPRCHHPLVHCCCLILEPAIYSIC